MQVHVAVRYNNDEVRSGLQGIVVWVFDRPVSYYVEEYRVQ